MKDQSSEDPGTSPMPTWDVSRDVHVVVPTEKVAGRYCIISPHMTIRWLHTTFGGTVEWLSD